MICSYSVSSVGIYDESNIFYAELVYEYTHICLLKRKFVNIEFIPSKFYFVCCKAFSVLNKIKWYCQIEGFPLRF